MKLYDSFRSERVVNRRTNLDGDQAKLGARSDGCPLGRNGGGVSRLAQVNGKAIKALVLPSGSPTSPAEQDPSRALDGSMSLYRLLRLHKLNWSPLTNSQTKRAATAAAAAAAADAKQNESFRAIPPLPV